MNSVQTNSPPEINSINMQNETRGNSGQDCPALF
jgi:hypothetical protein